MVCSWQLFCESQGFFLKGELELELIDFKIDPSVKVFGAGKTGGIGTGSQQKLNLQPFQLPVFTSFSLPKNFSENFFHT